MKLPIQTIQSLQNETSAVGIMNGNFLAIQTLIETLLSRDGLAPNQMTDVLDANNHSIINVPAPVVSTDVARLQDVMDVSAIASAAYEDAVAKLLAAKAKYDLAVVLLNAATTDVETALETIEGIQTNVENIEDNVEAIQVDLEASIANLVPEAPDDGEQYVRQNKDWAVVNIPDAGIPEAPNDGQQYVRQSEAWATIEIPDVPVTSVNGKEGDVILTTDDISEGTSKYTTAADILKLAGIETGAEVNTVDSVNGQTGTVVLDPDDLDDTSTTNKFTTAADISKLAGIEAGAQVNVPLKILTAVDTSTVTLPQNIYTNQTFSTTTRNDFGAGAWDGTTFTVPSAGVYDFYLNASWEYYTGNSTQSDVYFYINGSDQKGFMKYTNGDRQNTVLSRVVLALSAGDTVVARVRQNSSVSGTGLAASSISIVQIG